MEDIIGLEPSRESNPALHAALSELEGMTGLKSVKAVVNGLVSVAHGNYFQEKSGGKIDDLALNRLFIGNPGTGECMPCTIAEARGVSQVPASQLGAPLTPYRPNALTLRTCA